MAQLSEKCKRGEHTWIATTAANYRMCGESGCHVTQRLQDGTWIEIQPMKGTKTKNNKIAASTLCEQTGEHAWIATTAANYQKCQRVGCTAVVRFTGGVWIEAERTLSTQRHVPNTQQETMSQEL